MSHRGRLVLAVAKLYVDPMDGIARLLQLGGLILPILAILAQLNQAISVGQMLIFLVASLCLFYIGHFLRGGGQTP